MLSARYKIPIPRPRALLEPRTQLTLCARFIEAEGIGSIGVRYAQELVALGTEFSIWPTDKCAELVSPPNWRLLQSKMRRACGNSIVAISHEDGAFRNCRGARRFRVAMYEATQAPSHWVGAYNADGGCTLLVPDPWVAEMFAASGVRVPTRVVPLGVERAAACPVVDRPFVFGMSAYYEERKNHLLLVQAFKAAFEYDRGVRLLLHGRGGHTLDDVRRASAGDERISFEMRVLQPAELEAWWHSIDAYVLPSAGEGYSHTPRESLMRAIPTAITDFSAHVTLVKRGSVVPIPVRCLEPAYKEMFKAAIGEHAQVRVDDLVEVLRFMRNNRDATRRMAEQGREQTLELDTWHSSTLHLLAAINESS